MRFLRTQKERAHDLVPAELQHYLSDRIHVADWYPTADVRGLVMAAARILPVEDPLAFMGNFLAQEHAGGVYKRLHATHDLDSLMRRSGSMWSSIFDTGEFVVTREADQLHLRVTGFEDASAEICEVAKGYIAAAVETSGVPSPRLEKTACGARGDSLCAWVCRLPPDLG